jgi:putative PEP-CTERM system TPR-repeat lipoprotein
MLGRIFRGKWSFHAVTSALLLTTVSCSSEHPQTLYLQGADLEKQGRPAEAERRYQQVLSKDPNHIPALERYGRLLLNLQRRSEAAEPLERAVALSPTRLSAVEALASLRLDEHQTQAAEALIAPWKQETLPPSTIGFLRAEIALQKKDRASARQILDQISKQGAPDDARQAQVRLAGLDMVAGKWADAEKRLQAVLAADPKDLQALIGSGVAALGQGKTKPAQTQFAAAWKAPSKPPMAAVGLILCAVSDADLQRAAGAAAELAASQPGELNNAILVAELAVASNRADLLESLNMPESAGSLKQYVDGLRHFANQQYFDSYPLLTSVAKEWNTYAPAQIFAGRVAQGLKDRAQALEFFKNAEKIHPTSPELASVIARAALAESQTDLALKQLTRLAESDPDLPSLRLESAFRKGDYQEALAEAQKWKAADPNSAWARVSVADVQSALGNRPDALSIWSEVAASGDGAAQSWAAFRIAVAEEKWKEAHEALEKLAQTADKSMISILKGRIELSRGSMEIARGHFDAAIKDGPQNAKAYSSLGLWHVMQRQLTAANTNFLKALQLNPDDPLALWGEGLIEFLGKTYADAAVFFEKSLRANPNFDLSLLFLAETRLAQGQYAEALKRVDQLGSAVQQSAPVLDLRGRALILLQRWPEALEAWKTCQKEAPKSAVPYFYIAQIQFLQGNKEAARESIEAGLKLAPQDMRLQLARADILWQLGKRDEALLLSTQAAKNQKNLDAAIMQATMHLKQGHFSKASSLFKELLASNPDDPRLYALLYEAQLGLAKEDEAMLTLRTGWLRLPQSVVLGFELAAMQEKGKSWTDAISTYREILKIRPDDVRALNQLAWLLADQKIDLEGAFAAADRACKLDLGNVATQDTRAWVLFQQENFPDARKELEQLVKSAPDQPYIQYHWGLALWKTGDAAGARAALQKALQIDPKFSEAEKIKELLKQI